MDQDLFPCQLCQKFVDHPTKKCPTLICKNCQERGHSRLDCPISQNRSEPIITSPVYNPTYFDFDYDQFEDSDSDNESLKISNQSTEYYWIDEYTERPVPRRAKIHTSTLRKGSVDSSDNEEITEDSEFRNSKESKCSNFCDTCKLSQDEITSKIDDLNHHYESQKKNFERDSELFIWTPDQIQNFNNLRQEVLGGSKRDIELLQKHL